MEDPKPKKIEEYIEASIPESREIMNLLKELIETTVPGAKGVIAWNVPIYKYNGILAGFDVAKKHVSFGIDCLRDEDRKLLEEKGYKTGKSTIQIKFDQKVPTEEIQRLLREQSRMGKK